MKNIITKTIFLLLLVTTGCLSDQPTTGPDDLEIPPEGIIALKSADTLQTAKVTPPVVVEPTVPEFVCSKFINGADGPGGFVNNPNSSKKTLKVIFHQKYTNNIREVKVWTQDLKFKEKLTRREPNEYNDRQRYYGKKDIKSYPKKLIVGALLFDGRRICVKVPNPQKRLD